MFKTGIIIVKPVPAIAVYLLAAILIIGCGNLLVENIKLTAEISSLKISMGYLQQKRLTANLPIYGWPIHPEDYERLTSPFGVRRNPFRSGTGGSLTTNHAGVDMVGTWRARVTAVADGVVIDHWIRDGHPVLGRMIRILHDDGYVSVYGHLSISYVHEGDRVIRGQVIARQGGTGMSIGDHLHFELWSPLGYPVQPLRYIGVDYE